MDKSTSKFAKAYAAYISGWLGKSIYDAWFMFFAQIIWDAKSDEIDVVRIRDEFNRRYNMNIPIDFVRHTLSLKKQLFSLNRNRVLVIDRVKVEKYITPDRSYVETWALLKNAFRAFCVKNGVLIGSDLESMILDCVESYDVDVVAPHVDGTFKIDCEVAYKWNVFVCDLKESSPKLFDFVCALCYGSIAKESMLCTEGTCVVFRGLNVYLDAPLIFQLLGMADLQEQESARCLVSGLLESNCTLWVFRHTLEEVNSIAHSSKRWALDLCNYDPSRASKTARFFRNQSYTATEIDELICDIEGDLKDRFGVKIDNMTYDKGTNDFQVDVKCLREMFDEKYEYADEEEKEDKARGIENDIRSIAMLYRLRAGVKPKNFHQCRHLMVTSSSTMASVCKNFENTGSAACHIPVCVSSKVLASFLWFGNPKEFINYKRLELLADCSRYLKPNDRVLKKFFEKVTKVNAEDEQMRKKYFMLVTAPALDQVLMSTINGNEENITDNTIDEVCERLRTDLVAQYLEKEKRNKQQEKYAHRKRRNEKLKNFVLPFASMLWVMSFLLINGIVATAVFLLKREFDDTSFVGYIAFAAIDTLCIGGLIHEKWGVRLSKRCAIRMIRSLFSFFQY